MTERTGQSGTPYDVTRVDDAGFATQLIHEGESPVASAFPIYQANTVEGVYVRQRNPTVEALEHKVCRLEGGSASLAMASGMAAISSTMLGLVRPGAVIAVHRSLFIGAETFLNDYLTKLGVTVQRCDLTTSAGTDEALRAAPQLIYFETVSNPGLEVINAPAVIAAARRRNVLVIVDNTLLTPVLFRPLELGADVVIHSGTKYLSGHGDALAGVATFRDPTLAESIHRARRLLGGVLSPHSAFLVMRGMKTLALRMPQHCRNAAAVAAFLGEHPRVESVRYPGVDGTADHARAARFLTAFGGITTFQVRAPFDWDAFAARLKLVRRGMSFGDATTRIQRERDGVLRLSVGLEDLDDIIRDLEQALQ